MGEGGEVSAEEGETRKSENPKSRTFTRAC